MEKSSTTSLTNGGFVVTWQEVYNNDLSQQGVGAYGQLYASDGTTQGDQFLIYDSSDDPDSSAQAPAVTSLPDGGFVVMFGQTLGQRYASDGTPQGSQFQVLNAADPLVRTLSVTQLSDDRFVILFNKFKSDGYAESGVYAQRFSIGASLESVEHAKTSIGIIDNGISFINDLRSSYGAAMNRLEYAADNLTNIAQNTEAARSRILDTDYASETTELARTQIIQQAATAMLTQANQQAKYVLELLKSV